MVKKMTKEEFIKVLSEKLKCSEKRAKEVSDLLEDNCFIGKNNKEKTINSFINNLNVTKEEADEIFNVCMNTIKDGIKNRLLHPFKSK